MSIPFRDGYRTIIPSNLQLVPNATVEQLHADAQKLSRIPADESCAAMCHRLSKMYTRTTPGQTVYVWVGKPWFHIYVNRADIIPAGECESGAYYIAESLCN